MRGKQAREALRGERTGDHHRSHRLRAGGLLHRHRGRAAGNLAQRGSEALPDPPSTWNRLRRRRIRVCGEIAICISDAAIGARIVLSSTQQSQAAGRRIVAVVTLNGRRRNSERVARVRDDGGHGGKRLRTSECRGCRRA